MAPDADDDARDARARRDLEARVYGAATPLPTDVSALRDLLARAASRVSATESAPRSASVGRHADQLAEMQGGPEDARPGPAEQPTSAAHPRAGRPRRMWVVGGATAVVLAGAVGVSLGSSILRSGPSPTVIATTAAAGGLSGATDDYRARSENISHAESEAAEYFSQPQDDSDVPGIAFPGVIASTTRKVLTHWGQTSSDPSVWVARGSDGGFCLVATEGSTGAASCASLEDVLATGVRLELADTTGASVVVRWDLSSGLLQMTPKAGASGPPPATP